MKASRYANPLDALEKEDFDKLEDLVSKARLDFSEIVAALGLSPQEDFQYRNLTDVNFGNADLTHYNFRGSDLSGADFSRCKNLTSDMLLNCTIDSQTNFGSFAIQEQIEDSSGDAEQRLSHLRLQLNEGWYLYGNGPGSYENTRKVINRRSKRLSKLLVGWTTWMRRKEYSKHDYFFWLWIDDTDRLELAKLGADDMQSEPKFSV